ncbi:hypothetical protein [Neobacillus ginsengisoli]|uniref:Uncharacterized protein n=1 Tax=Neobacillus ginsengisoli TaxID=904295 RepID=A0ABT9XVS5_9BACI|nr:hypothetical protein [Neobacillus ginsengisoli]MDQ0199675.1 hypothetical protein [Neobacillus ginsengisoli]
MKKKVLAAVGISGLLMAGGVLSASASASGNGYQLFKDSVKKTQTLTNFTSHVEASLTDNGKKLYSVNSLSSENLTAQAASSNVNVTKGGKTTNLNYYSKNHQTIVKSSNDTNYYVRQGHVEKNEQQKNENHNGHKLSPQMQKDVEAIFDAITTNYQDKINSSDLGNGNTGLSFELTKDQVPAVGQAVVSFFLKNIDQNKEHFGNREFGSLNIADLKPVLPQLTSGISVDKVVLNGIVDKNNYLMEQDATIHVTGTDVKGTTHSLVLSIKNQFDNINNSKVNTIDLKGKKVVTVQDNHKRHED